MLSLLAFFAMSALHLLNTVFGHAEFRGAQEAIVSHVGGGGDAAGGADLVVSSKDFVAGTKEATGGKGVDLAVNLVGGTVFAACQKSLGNFGRLAVVGYVDGAEEFRHTDQDENTSAISATGTSA